MSHIFKNNLPVQNFLEFVRSPQRGVGGGGTPELGLGNAGISVCLSMCVVVPTLTSQARTPWGHTNSKKFE